MKRRLRLGVMLALLLVLGIAAIVKHWQSTSENHRITKENFEQIADGMTQAEVEEILGSPAAVESYPNEKLGRTVTWETIHTENHHVYKRIITLPFDQSAHKRENGAYTNAQVDIDAWLTLKHRVEDWRRWLTKG